MNFISNFNWRPTLSGIALSLLLATGCAQRHNTLSEQEIADGWELLFDGKTLDAWKDYNGDSLTMPWRAVDGCIQAHGDGSDLHRHQETVRKLHPRLGLETLLRRQQRNALPRGRRPLLQGALRHGARIPAHRRSGLGGDQRPHQARTVAAAGRRLRHAPARSRFAVRQPAGRVEQLAHRLRQRPRRALAQR